MDVSITTVLFEISPLGLVLLTAWLFRSESRYQRIGPLTALAFLAAVAGVALVVLSHAGDVDLTRVDEYVANAPLALAGGVGLALGAAALASLGGFGFRWAADLAKDLPQDGKHDTDSLEIFSVLVGVLVGTLFALPVLALVGSIRNEPVVPGSLWLALIGGLSHRRVWCHPLALGDSDDNGPECPSHLILHASVVSNVALFPVPGGRS